MLVDIIPTSELENGVEVDSQTRQWRERFFGSFFPFGACLLTQYMVVVAVGLSLSRTSVADE